MTGVDPAVAAARRALRDQFGKEFQLDDNHYTIRVRAAAAREALAPVRRLHQPTYSHGRGAMGCSSCWATDGNRATWPCATAELIYSAEELASG